MTDGAVPGRQVRISDADRERAAQLLQQALTEGRISIAELDERMQQLYEARFANDLEAPFVDLPSSPVAALAPFTGPVGGVLAGAPTASDPGDVVTLSTGWATLKRDGRWVVPARLSVEVSAGSMVLDCTQAQIPHRVVSIGVSVRSGSFKLILGPGMTADINGISLKSGTARSKVDAVPDQMQPHFVLSGTVGSGSLIVRRPLFG
ncbi:MAG: DUF1707 domain-containing protein [Nakamurella sp.]